MSVKFPVVTQKLSVFSNPEAKMVLAGGGLTSLSELTRDVRGRDASMTVKASASMAALAVLMCGIALPPPAHLKSFQRPNSGYDCLVLRM
jgi:rhamnose utilization protein RhaD (predicted bifunctional aldolase and dehydrogenase)